MERFFHGATSIVSRHLLAGLCVLGLMMITGCGGGGDSVKTVDAEGTVTLDGQPLANAEVEFQPVAGGSPSYGKTDASGHYTLMFTMNQDGAMPGENKVRITTGGQEDDAGNISEETLPEKYNVNTELTATVEKGGGPYDFDLTSK